MTTTNISSGNTVTDFPLANGDILNILSGGASISTTVVEGASEVVFGGGFTSTTIVNSVGSLTLSGGVASFTVLSGGDMDVLSGGIGVATRILNGTELVEKGGVESKAAIGGAQAAELIVSGGTASGAVVNEGGVLAVSAGSAVFTSVNAGEVFVEQSGSLFLTTVSGGVVDVASGGVAKVILVDAPGELIVGPSGVASGVVLSGFALVSSGGLVSGMTVYSGGIAEVAGDSNAATVMQGGVETVMLGGNSLDATIDSGGLQTVLVGEADGATVLSGGLQVISALGTSFFSEVQGGGRVIGERFSTIENLQLSAGGVLSVGGQAFTNTLSGGREVVVSSGFDQQAFIMSGARLVISSAGSGAFETVFSSGFLTVSTGGIADFVITEAGGQEVISSGGSAFAADVSGIEVIAGGVTTSDHVFVTAELVVRGGGVALKAVDSGGRINVSSGGLASGATVSTGVLSILTGGAARATRVLNGGSEVVEGGGVASGTVVGGGGLATIFASGVASGLSLSGGGKVTDNGAIVIAKADTIKGQLAGSGTIAQTATQDLVLSGVGTGFTGRALLSAGRIELAGKNALGSGKVSFVVGTHAETLQIDAANAPAAGGTFVNTIADFTAANQAIDLRSIAFVAGAKATVSGSTLTLADGGHAYKFTLAGAAASTFTVAGDGAGGTKINPHVTTSCRRPRRLATLARARRRRSPPAGPAAMSRCSTRPVRRAGVRNTEQAQRADQEVRPCRPR